MKIAMMTNNYKPYVAGVPISVERLTEGLRRRGHQVVVFAPSYDDQEEEADVVRYRSLLRGVACGFSVPDSLDPKIERSFRDGNFDVIHVHHPMLIGRTARYLSRKYQIPLVFTYHTRYEQYLHYVGMSGLSGLLPYYIRSCTKQCDLVIAPTQKIKEHLEKIGIDPPIRVLPTGLMKDAYFPDEARSREIRERFLKRRRYLFLTVARLAKEKNLDFLLNSLRIFKEKNGADFRFVMVGEGPERKRLEQKAEALGLTDEICFVGKVQNEEIKNYCHASDLFLFASGSETQGIVLLEAMAAGTPVLALQATGTEDIVQNGINGYMTQASEIEFAEKLMDILEKKEIAYLRQGALATAGNYESSRIAREAEEAYRSIFAGCHRQVAMGGMVMIQ